MSEDKTVMKFICPLLAALAAVVALFGPWFTRTEFISGDTISYSLLDVLQGNSRVDYESQAQIFIAGAGLLLVLASAFVNGEQRRKFAASGSALMLILPAWSLIQIYVDDVNFGAGWAMWAAAVIAIVSIMLARMIPEEKPQEFVAPQIDQQPQ